MPQVFAGVVEFTTPRPFEAKSAKVTLSFTIADGEDAEAATAMVGALARRQASTMIGEQVEQSPRPVLSPPTAEDAAIARDAAPAKAARRTAPKAAATPPAGDGWGDAGPTSGAATADTASPPAETPAAPPVITDDMLNKACSAKAQAFAEAGVPGGTVRIHALRAAFTGSPTKKITEVEDMDARREFLAQLKDLPVAA